MLILRYLAAAKLAQHIPEPRLGSSKIIIDVASRLQTRYFYPTSCSYRGQLEVPDGYQTTPAHQDWRSVQGSLDIVLWLPLSEHEKAFWPLEVAKCSHRLGILNTKSHPFGKEISDKKIDRFSFTKVEAKPGDIVVFSMFLAHRTGSSERPGVRWAISFRFNNTSEPSFISRGFPNPYIYKSDFDLINDYIPDTELLNKIFDKN